MRPFLRRLTLVLVAVVALWWPPTRRLIADILLTVATHLEHLDDPPGPTPQQRARMRETFVDEVAAALVRRGRGEPATERTDINGHHPVV